MKTATRTAIAWSALNWARKNAERILGWDVRQNPSYDTELSRAFGRDGFVCRNKENAVLIKVEDEIFEIRIDGSKVAIDF